MGFVFPLQLGKPTGEVKLLGTCSVCEYWVLSGSNMVVQQVPWSPSCFKMQNLMKLHIPGWMILTPEYKNPMEPLFSADHSDARLLDEIMCERWLQMQQPLSTMGRCIEITSRRFARQFWPAESAKLSEESLEMERGTHQDQSVSTTIQPNCCQNSSEMEQWNLQKSHLTRESTIEYHFLNQKQFHWISGR